MNNERKRFHTFVANRVKMICDFTDVEQWRYVPSEIKPANYASRGTTGKQFTEAMDWLMGPKFLWDSGRNFPSENVSTADDERHEAQFPIGGATKTMRTTFERCVMFLGSQMLWFLLA